MTTYRYTVLVLENHAGFFAANLVDDEDAPAALGASAQETIAQLKEYLEWQHYKHFWYPAPEMTDARMVFIRVAVRPEYQAENRSFPCAEPVILRMPCVYGKSQSFQGGNLVCSIPTLGYRFFFNEPGRLKELVNHYVNERLRGSSPRELSRHLPHKSAFLDEIVIQVNRREYRETPTPSLEVTGQVAEPLGDKRVRKGYSRAWEREREVSDLVRRVGEERSNVLIVGEPGCGKTSVLIEAVREIESRRTDGRENFRHWMTSGARLIAGMQYLGMWQERCEKLVEEMSEINGFLCFENLLELMKTGSGDASDSIAGFFLPYLQRGELKLIAEATPAELDACRKILPGFVDMFQVVRVEKLNGRQALSVIARLVANQSQHSRVPCDEDVPATICNLFQRFEPYQALPGRAVPFIHELFERAKKEGPARIGRGDVTGHFARLTGLPEILLLDELPLDYSDVLAHFRRSVIGQDAACEAAAGLVAAIKAGLNDPNRPFGVLLFCGPTGVGKTEMARAITRFLFGHGESGGVADRFIQLDLSEFAGWGAAYRLLAGADGEPSELIRRVRKQPFCVLLLDEIEKADAEIFDIFLSVFDEGRLTDHFGRVTNFRSAVIIMTSNLGADKLQTLGFETGGQPSYAREAMNFFRPEFFNRIDAVIQFKPLDRAMMRNIARKELSELSDREGMHRFGIELEWSDDLIEHLVDTGFDHRYGARPLQRTIESLIVAPLAKYLLDNPDRRGVTVRISLDDRRRAVRFDA